MFAKVLMYLLLIIDVLIVALVLVLYFKHVDDGIWGEAWNPALFLLGVPAVFLTLINWIILFVTKPKITGQE